MTSRDGRMGLCLLTVWRHFECFVGARVQYVRVLTIGDHVIQLDRTDTVVIHFCDAGKWSKVLFQMCFRTMISYLS